MTTPDLALAAAEQRGRDEERATMRDPDYYYDSHSWEYTVTKNDRYVLAEGLLVREVLRCCTLFEGPDRWAAHVVVTRDENGDPDETTIRWFDSVTGPSAPAMRQMIALNTPFLLQEL